MSKTITSASIAFALLCTPAAADFTTFQVPGATATHPRAIANSGVVIGFFDDPSGAHGFIRATNGVFTTIDVSGATVTDPVAIRSDGTIVGLYSVQSEGRYAWLGFVRAPDGRITQFQAPHGGIYTSPVSINNTGWIAGTGEPGGKQLRAFGFLRSPSGHFWEFGNGLMVRCANSTNTTAGQLYQGSQWHGFVRTPDGALAQFDPDGATLTTVTAINYSGTATGSWQLADGHYEGFIRAADGTLSTFVASQNAKLTFALGINKAGAIVGDYRDQHNFTHGFVRAPNGGVTTLDAPEAFETDPYGINDKGQIVGEFDSLENGIMGFIWKR